MNVWWSLGILTGCHTMTETGHQLGPWPEVIRPMGCTKPNTFTFTGSWVWEKQKLSVSLLIGVIAFQQILGPLAYALWPTHWEPRGHMKINWPVFEDEDKKDVITYQSWCWDIMVYHWAGCWDHTLLPYIICSLQGYPGELVRGSSTDVTLDGMPAMLYEHYYNVKDLDTLNQEFFQLQMGEKKMVSEWGCASFESPPNPHSLIPRVASARPHSQTEPWPLLQWAT